MPLRILTQLLPTALALTLGACSSLPVPAPPPLPPSPEQQAPATALLRASAAAHGDPWQTLDQVQISLEGEWSRLATRLQPTLTDPGYRVSSLETYRPPLNQVEQLHRGPAGTKSVLRSRPLTQVSYGDQHTDDPEVIAAAALVADAYTIFLFGTSWLVDHAADLRLLPTRDLDGTPCLLVAGRLTPGLGHAPEDHFITWIEQDSLLLRRFQFSLEGLDSTRGADVDITFSNISPSPSGHLWPHHFLETIQRPLRAVAHEWHLRSIKTQP